MAEQLAQVGITAKFKIKQGDTLPVYNDQLQFSDGTFPNLTGHSVHFVMRALTASDVTINAAATLGNSSAAASVGGVSYTFTTTDTKTPGLYMAYWEDLTAGETYPTDGYLAVEIQDNLTTPGGAMLLSVADCKEYLRINETSHTHDTLIARWIRGVTPLVEHLCGPILQHTYFETYDGGSYFVSLRHRPVLNVESVWEFRGPVLYNLQQVANPAEGTIYSYMVTPGAGASGTGRIVRRTVGGGQTTWPPGADTVFVNYTAGYATVPENVRLGALEIIRETYQQTQQRGPAFSGGTSGSAGGDGPPTAHMTGYFVPDRARELLSPSFRHPSIA